MNTLKTITRALLITCLIGAVFIAPDAWAQKKKKKKGAKTEAASDKKDDAPKKIADQTKKHQKIDGLFTFYRDSTSGSLKMVVTADQLNKEFIHFYYYENGVTSVLMNRGVFRGEKIFTIKKYYDRLEFITQNTAYYFDPENPISKAADANISDAIMFSAKIEAGSTEEGAYLIKADPLFLTDALGVVDVTAFSKDAKAFKLGGLSKSKTKYADIRNYEQNADIIVQYAYDNKKAARGAPGVTDPRYVNVKVQHSLIAVPQNDYKPRLDDPRVGYFMTQVTDMTTTDAIPYRDLIHRWHLVKKDKDAALSEPVAPITWWIENTTPMAFRPAIKKGVLAWNKAFEQAGFKNAVVVKEQPDTATWDAGDIRYNVLRWTSSANPPFGGYGPSFVNPRTGQILGADIMLEFVHHTNRVKYAELYKVMGSHDAEAYSDPRFCMASEMSQFTRLFGRSAMLAAGAEEKALKGMEEQAMISLVMHEVGHTLGLNHNMKASQRFSPEQLADKALIKGQCLTGSVMDYTTINLTLDPTKQGQYYDVAVGPYDIWTIQCGYTPVKDPSDLDKILAKSTQPELIFGNDADDMRAPGRGIDPRVMIFDLSNDPITYSIDRFKIVNRTMNTLKNKYTKAGESYQTLQQAYDILSREYANAGVVISRFIGGVFVDRAMAGQAGAKPPYTPVPYAEQKRALKALAQYVFSPEAFKTPTALYNYLARQRRGFNFFGGNEDPKIHAGILAAQRNILNHLMHVNTLQRITDSQLYGNQYTLSEYMKDLNQAMFKADATQSVNTFRQNLQVEYVKRLIQILDTKSPYSHMAKSMALYNAESIKRIAADPNGNTATKAHRKYLRFLIDQALEKKG